MKTFEDYFSQIKNIWSVLNLPNRIIPFCTPMKLKPKFLIIGLNHSDFAPDNRNLSNQIANEFSTDIPKVNTFVKHRHLFAQGLKKVIQNVQMEFKDFDANPTNEWLGTNRIAIQTDGKGAEYIINHEGYEECQAKMDKLLISLVKFMKPKNVLLVGKDASCIFSYNKKLKIDEMKYLKFNLDDKTNETSNIIPIHHFSRGVFHAPAAKRIKEAIKNGFCDY